MANYKVAERCSFKRLCVLLVVTLCVGNMVVILCIGNMVCTLCIGNMVGGGFVLAVVED